MKWWSTPQQALLNALEADTALPWLFACLTDGVLKPLPADVSRLRDWPVALHESPCGPRFKALLDANPPTASTKPNAQGFETHWRALSEAGFSDRAAHHHALLFLTLSERLLDSRHFALAERLTRLAAQAWRQILLSDYLTELFRKLGGIEAGLIAHETTFHLLDAEFDARLEDVRALLRARGPELDREQLTFYGRWFAIWDEPARDTPELEMFAAYKARFESAASLQIAQEIDDRLNELELSTAPKDVVTAVFSDARAKVELLNFPAAGVEEVISRAINTLWLFRRVKRDDDPVFAQVIDETMPLLPALERQIAAGVSVGHNARCADLLVFRAERERGEKRIPFLERALHVSPGHRNASMLSSYLHLHDANISLSSAETSMTKKAARKALIEARAHIDLATSRFSSNVDLPTYEDRFLKACFKHDLQPHELHET